MIEGAATVGYSSSTTAESIGGKYLGSFPGFSQRSDHHIVGGIATTNTSSLPTSRMHLVDSWRESIMKHSYEKQDNSSIAMDHDTNHSDVSESDNGPDCSTGGTGAINLSAVRPASAPTSENAPNS